MRTTITCIVAPLTMLACVSTIAGEMLILSGNYSHGAGQGAELLVDNTHCGKSVNLTVTVTGPDGLIVHEALHVVQQGAAVIPLPAPSDRNRHGLEVALDQESCAELTYAALAVVNGDDSTATMRHGSEWTDYNTHDPGVTSTASGVRDRVHIAPTRLGPDQTGEMVFRNTCPEDIVVALDVTDLETGVSKAVELQIPSRGVRVLPLRPAANGVPMYFSATGRATGVDRRGNPCPKASGAIVGSLELVDAQGNTVASGLPTGKRRHHPFTVSRPRGEE